MATFRPGQGADTAYFYTTYGVRTGLTDGEMAFGGAGGGYISHSAARFPNVTIPQGATILTAKITFTASRTKSTATCNAIIAAQDSDDSSIFVEDISSPFPDWNDRPQTTATVAWNSVPSETLNVTFDTPDFTSVVQEVIDRVGWASGNALTIFVNDNSSSADAFRGWWAYDSNVKDPILTVTYSVGSPSSAKSQAVVIV